MNTMSPTGLSPNLPAALSSPTHGSTVLGWTVVALSVGPLVIGRDSRASLGLGIGMALLGTALVGWGHWRKNHSHEQHDPSAR
jgi:hypothetical protein